MLNLSETKKAKTTFPRLEEGTYAARIARIIDFGMQYATDWKTGERKQYDDGNDVIQHKVWIDFEFPTETIEIDGEQRPRWQGKEYTVSAHEKAAIQALLKAADPSGKATAKGRNVAGLLGLPLMVSIGSTNTNKPKITNVAALMKGMSVPELANPTLFFDLDEVDLTTFESLPDWMKKRIQEGVDFDKTAFYKKYNSFEDLEEAGKWGDESPY
jgi:hypothetical protein